MNDHRHVGQRVPERTGVGNPAMRPIVVYAPSFNENSGGCLVLHALVDRLRARGVDAYLHFYLDHDVRRLYRGMWARIPDPLRVRPVTWFLKNCRRFWFGENMRVRTPRTSGFLDTPIADRRILEEAVVVYPESIHGNPLRARRVARWLLYLPGFHFKEARFGRKEELFYYEKEFRGDYVHLGPDRRLNVALYRDDVYHDRSKVEPRVREGACHMVRKGRSFGMHPDALSAEGKLVIDGKSHEEIGEIFRRCEYLVSYDCNSMYHFYAVMCGCVPILLKPPDMPQELFDRLVRKRPGFAIGFEDVDRAKRTREEFLEMVRSDRRREDESVDAFLRIVNDAFPPDAGSGGGRPRRAPFSRP